jgi:hypothetical protein
MNVLDTALRKLYYQYVGLSMSVFSRRPIGTNVFQREWDVLLILDTCRVDALLEVAPEYDFITNVDSIISVGSCSPEWIGCTFTEKYSEEIEDTIYISANAFAERVLGDRQFPDSNRGLSWSNWKTVTGDELLELDQPWKYAPEPPHGHIRPEHLTDRAVANAREHDSDRLIVHYSQPHPPYTANADAEGRELKDYESNPRSYLKEGGDLRKVWKAYLDNLRLVLDEVEIVLQNIDAKTVAISADHGEAFGEWGVYWHLAGLPHPKLKKVPWVITSAEDTGEFETSLKPTKARKDVHKHLRDLGYIEEADQVEKSEPDEAKAPGANAGPNRQDN